MNSTENKTFNNSLRCLQHNEQLHKLISETISNIDRNIESLKDSQDYLLSQVKKEDQLRGSYVMQFINGQNTHNIRTPYFITSLGLTPPTTDTEKNKVHSGSFNFYDLKRKLLHLCSQKDLEIMKEAIGKQVYDIEMNRFTHSTEKTKAKEFQSFRSSSFEALSARCDNFMMDKIDWLGISVQNLHGKLTPENCRKIWENTFNPQFESPFWTDAKCRELLKLTTEIGEHGQWGKIASKMSFKIPPHQCFKKWLELTSKMETDWAWGAEDDVKLCETVDAIAINDEHNKKINWNKVALMVPNRSARDCEKRWNSLQNSLNSRPFSDGEDYQLLLLIKRMGMENWPEIARELDQRNVEQCQRRYCELVEELHPWSYIEDRSLWLSLRPHYKDLYNGHDRVEDFSRHLQLYKSVMHYFNGRCPLVIRHRYVKLCHWFSLWNKFYLCLSSKKSNKVDSVCQTTSLLSDICPEQTSILSRIGNIIFKTSFFDALRKALQTNGSQDPDSDAAELIKNYKNGDSKLLDKLLDKSTDQNLMEYLLFFVDLKSGTFIPRHFEKYIHRRDNALKNPEKADFDLRCLSTNVRSYEVKTAIVNTLKKRLNELSIDSDINQRDKECIDKLLNCEGKFISALNFAVDSLRRTHDFRFVIKVDVLEKVLPQLLKLMLQYVYDQKNSELVKKSLSIRFNHEFATKREHIGELLIYRQYLSKINKTYPDQKKPSCFITKNVPRVMSKNLMNENKIKHNASKIYHVLSSLHQESVLDCASSSSFDDFSVALKKINLFTPNRCTLHLLRAFLLQKQDLIQSSGNELTKLVRLKYDHPINYLQADEAMKQQYPMEIYNENTGLSDPRYHLLKTRVLSLLAIPSLIARISPLSAAHVADKLHEVQNNVKYSTEISKSFNSISMDSETVYGTAGSANHIQMTHYSTNSRKRKILECLDEEDFVPEPNEKPSTSIRTSHHNTRSVTQNWISIYLPDSKRNVFVSKDIFHPFIASNFTIDSINGIKVSDFMNE